MARPELCPAASGAWHAPVSVNVRGQVAFGNKWFQRRRPGSPRRVSRLRSLPARISIFVFGATLVTSIFVTAISVQEIDAYLRTKIELKFPKITEETTQRLNAWYDQQFLNLGVLAASDVLKRNIVLMEPGTRDEKEAAGPSHDVAEYLAYVLERFAEFDSLFVLHPGGETLIWVGREIALPRELTDELLASEDPPRPRLTAIGDQFVQIVSLRIDDREGKKVGILSAVIPLDSASTALRAKQLGETGEIYLVDARNVFLAVGRSQTNMGTLATPLPTVEQTGKVIDYRNDAGDRVVGYALALSQHGLALAVEERYDEAFAPLLTAFRRVLSINVGVVLLFGLAAFRVAVSIARPIEALSEVARKISEDVEDVEIPDNQTRDEVGVLTRTFKEMTARLANKAEALERSQAETEQAVLQMRDKNAELQRVNEVLEQLSITDGLTQLHNHRFFQEQLAKEIKRTNRVGDPLSLILIDIDHFKSWNDRLGHAGGDEILRSIARVMNELVRETDILARYGGEEFAVILPKTDLAGAVKLAEKIRSTVADCPLACAPADHDERLTVSIGVGVYDGDAKALFAGADRALYAAKDGGRDCVMTAAETG